MRSRTLAALVGVILFGLFAMMTVPRPAADPTRHDVTASPAAAANRLPSLGVVPMPQDQAAGPASAPPTGEARSRKMREMRLARERRHSRKSFSAEEKQILGAVTEHRRRELDRQVKASADSYSYDGSGFGATFDPEGVSFTPACAADATAATARRSPLSSASDRARISLDRLRCGEQELARGDRVQPSLDAADRAVVYDRGVVRDRYILLQDSIEQTFVINDLPARRGDILVHVNVKTSMTAPKAGTVAPSLAFTSKGKDALTISKAAVVDASNRRLDLDLAWDGSGYAMKVPASWVNAATLPITIDPLLEPVIEIDDDTTSGFEGMDVAYDPADNLWFVVWSEGTMDMDSWTNLYGQRVGADGALLGAKITIDAAAEDDSVDPAVEWSPTANQFLVVWGQGFIPYQIVGQRFDKDGELKGAREVIIDGGGWNLHLAPDVAWGEDAWLVVVQFWPSKWVILACSLTPDAPAYDTATIGSQFTVYDGVTDDSVWPSVAYNSDVGKFLVAWRTGDLSSGDCPTVVARTVTLTDVDSSAVTVGSGSDQFTGSPPWYWQVDERISVSAGSGNQWIVCWGADAKILAQRIDSNGALYGSQIVVRDGGADILGVPCVTWSSINNEWFVTWSEGAWMLGLDVYGNRVSPDGTVIAADPYQVSITGEEPRSSAPPVASGSNAALFAWPSSTDPYPLQCGRFSLDFVPPTAPACVSPGDGAETGDSTPTLMWTAATDSGGSGLDHYHWQIAANATFTLLVQEDNTTELSAVPAPLADGIYYWQVWAVDGAGNVGPAGPYYTLTIDTSLNFAAIGSINQYKMDDATAITLGTYTTQNEVHVVATITDPLSRTISLEVEMQPTGAAFTGTYTSATAFLSSGSTFIITLTPAEGTYHWQYRAYNGDYYTNWTPFNAAATHFGLDYAAPSAPACSSPANSSTSGNATPILTWTAAADGTGSGVDHYEWEIATDTGFGTVIQSGSKTTLSVTSATLANGTYYWHVKAVDTVGHEGAFGSYFAYTVNLALNNPSLSNVNQYMMDNLSSIPLGGTTGEDEVHLLATVTDPAADTVKLEVELQPAGTAFTGNATHSTAFLSSGSRLGISLALPDGSYHWQYRARNFGGYVTEWTPFNAADTHFMIDRTQPPAETPTTGSKKKCGLLGIEPLLILGLLALARRRARH